MNQPQNTPIRKHRTPLFLLELLRLALLALVYVIFIQVSLLFVVKPEGITPIWPASGLGLAVLLLNPRKRWPGMLSVIFVVTLITNWSNSKSLPASLFFALANTLETALCAWALTYFRKTRLTFDNIVDVFALAGVAFIINAFTALLGAAAASLTFGASFFDVWRIWWVGNALGILLITPVLMTWTLNPGLGWLKRSGKSFEADLLTITLIVFSVLIFGPFTLANQPILHEYMIFPLLGWLAFRFSPRSMSSALLLIAVIAFWGTLQHIGIFAHETQKPIDELIYLQIYLIVITFSGLLLSAVLAERKRANETIKIAEANYRNILENAPIGFFQSSFDGRFLAVNPQMAQIFGYNSPQEMLESITDIGQQIYADPSVREETKRLLAEKGQLTDSVNQYRRKDGSIFWTTTNVRIVKDKNGQPSYLEGFPQDIDERIKAEKELQESRRFVQATMDSLSAHICVLEVDGTILAVNQAWLDFAEQNPPVNGNVSVGVNYLQVCDATTGPEAEMAHAFAAGIRTVLTGESDSYYLEYPCHAPHEQRWFIGRVMRFADEGSQRVVVAHENITERKLAENALRENEARLKFSQQVAHLGHWTWDTLNNKVLWSDEMYRIFGLDPITVDGDLDKIIAQAIHPEDREKVIQSNNTVLTEQKPVPMEYRIIWPDQSVHTVWAEAGENVRDESGKIIKLSGIVQDITARKKAENALRESEASLKFSQQVAHVGHWTWDAATNHVTFSDEMYRIFGLDPVSFDGNLDTIITNAVHPEDREKVYQSRNSTYTQQKPIPIEHRIILPDQSIRTVWAEAGENVYAADGTILQLSGIVQDITERKRAENELNRYLTELKILYENALATSALQEPHEIGKKIIETLSSNLEWHHVVVRLKNHETNDLDLIAFDRPGLNEQDKAEEEKRLNSLIKTGRGLSGWVAQTGQTIRTGNVQEHEHYFGTYPNIHSGIYVPIIINEQIIGSITVESEAKNAFTEQDERLVNTLAAQTAIAFENIRLYQNVQHELQERKRAEDALRASEEFAISIANNIPGMLGYWTNDLHCAFANKEYLTWFGRTSEEMRGITIQTLMGPELFQKNEPYIHGALRGEAQQFERTLVRPDGEVGYTWAQYIPHHVDGKIEGFFALVSDITQIKHGQERLRISEEKWRSLFAILPVGISILDAEHKVADFNPALAEILSVTAEGLRDGAYTRRKYLRADGSPMPPEEFPTARAMRNQIVVQSAQVGIVKEDSTLIWVEISAAPLALPDSACVVVTTDVTRRKQIEQALQHANDRLSMAQHASHAGVWDWDITSSTFNWSPELFDLFGLYRNIQPTADVWFNTILEQDRQLAREKFGQLHNVQNESINSEYRIVLPSKEIRWVNILGSIIRNEQGQVARLSGICLDITARKQAEEALRQSERNIRTFFETMTEGMALNEVIYNENGEMIDYRILDVNPTFYATADFRNIDVIGSLATNLYGMSTELIKQFWQEHKDKNTTVYTEMFSPLNHKWFYIATSPFVEGKFVTSFLDITPQKEKEQQLIQANEQLSLAQRSAGAGLWEWDMTQDFFNWSPELLQLFGLEPNITPNADLWLNIIHEQDRQSAAEYLNIGVHHDETINYEYRIVLPSGEIRWVNFLGKTIYDEQNHPQRMTGICIDITARKQAENALLESEARLKGIVVSAMDGIVMIDSQQRITLFNEAAEKMFGLSAKQTIGQPLSFIMPPEKHSLHQKHIEHFGETGVTTRSMSALMDVSAVRSTGEVFPIEASISQFIVAGQKFYTAILRDVTQRNEMEASLRASIVEKEALLKEVHHRVKNNLQIVSSLLSMQANSSKNDKVTQALEESKNRVRAMALIHEKLYRSENLEYIQAEEYIPELTNYLSGSLVGHERTDIRFDMQIAHITFDIGRAIPCGMIITELVSNALKYAFKPGEPGTIKVYLEVVEGQIRLMVSDNGIGLPLEINYQRPDTLGLELVSILSRQLKAELQVIRQPGTTFIISFRQ